MTLLRGREPEDVEPTLHPTISHEVLDHIRAWGYLVTEAEGLGADIAGLIERNRHKTSAAISLLIMKRIRGKRK